jgi:hypothetical protein
MRVDTKKCAFDHFFPYVFILTKNVKTEAFPTSMGLVGKASALTIKDN